MGDGDGVVDVSLEVWSLCGSACSPPLLLQPLLHDW